MSMSYKRSGRQSSNTANSAPHDVTAIVFDSVTRMDGTAACTRRVTRSRTEMQHGRQQAHERVAVEAFSPRLNDAEHAGEADGDGDPSRRAQPLAEQHRGQHGR
jgi:hypothetical protein